MLLICVCVCVCVYVEPVSCKMKVWCSQTTIFFFSFFCGTGYQATLAASQPFSLLCFEQDLAKLYKLVLQFLVFVSQPPTCWDHRDVPARLAQLLISSNHFLMINTSAIDNSKIKNLHFNHSCFLTHWRSGSRMQKKDRKKRLELLVCMVEFG